MKSVFLIKSPLQLMNAVEAKKHFDLDVDDCVLIIMGDRKSQPQILNLAKLENEWGKIIVLNNINPFFGNPFENYSSVLLKYFWGSKIFNKSVFNVPRLNRVSKFIGEVEFIFIGYARSIYMRHFVNKTPHEKVFLLDDGNATIKLAKERRDSTLTSGLSFEKNLKLLAKRFFQGVMDQEKESLCFFTIYDIDPGKNDHVVKNDFSYIRSGVGSLKTTADVYFLGSPITEVGIISKKDYLDHLSRVKRFYGNRNLVYIAHRRESSEKIQEIKQMFGLEVVMFEYPVEYQLAMIGPRPEVLASFFSSALDNCRLIFDDKLKITSFKLDLEKCSSRDDIESVYRVYDSNISDCFNVETLY